VLHFDRFTARHALKMIATSGFLTALECTKFVFGFAADPAGGSYSAPPGLLAGLRGSLLLKERGGKGKGGERRGSAPKANSWIRLCVP